MNYVHLEGLSAYLHAVKHRSPDLDIHRQTISTFPRLVRYLGLDTRPTGGYRLQNQPLGQSLQVIGASEQALSGLPQL